MKKIIPAVFLGFAATIFFSSICKFKADVDDIQSNVFRLHILANSDSEEDQNLKLMVRDGILELSDELFDGQNLETAIETAQNSLDIIEHQAESILRENGCYDDVICEIASKTFNNREYDGFTMPAGEYLSLCVYIGNAQGQNWWCVMYPPLCVGACEKTVDDYFDDDQTDILENHNKYEVKFKCVEIFESIKTKLFSLIN